MDKEKIISFPSREVRSLAELQRILSEYILDEDMRTFVYGRIHKMWAEESAHPLNLQIDPEEYNRVKEIGAFFQESNSRWILELIKAYAELYDATHPC